MHVELFWEQQEAACCLLPRKAGGLAGVLRKHVFLARGGRVRNTTTLCTHHLPAVEKQIVDPAVDLGHVRAAHENADHIDVEQKIH